MNNPSRKPVVAGVALLFSLACAQAQSTPQSGLYQIDSGTFIQKGGLTSETDTILPSDRQAFVQLFVGTNAGSVGLTFLGWDLLPGFTSLTNGSLTGGTTIRFQYVITNAADSPLPVPATVDYTVTNDSSAIWISGSITSTVACCDMVYEFEHRLVRASLASMPLSIRVSEVELCWSSETNRMYQVQYQSDLTTNQWVNLGAEVPASGASTCVTDKVIAGQPRRFYRVLTVVP